MSRCCVVCLATRFSVLLISVLFFTTLLQNTFEAESFSLILLALL